MSEEGISGSLAIAVSDGCDRKDQGGMLATTLTWSTRVAGQELPECSGSSEHSPDFLEAEIGCDFSGLQPLDQIEFSLIAEYQVCDKKSNCEDVVEESSYSAQAPDLRI